MESQTTNCIPCGLKHLAFALSLCKHVPVDAGLVLGELSEAHVHLSPVKEEWGGLVDKVRENVGVKGWPEIADAIRKTWVVIEKDGPIGSVEEVCPVAVNIHALIGEIRSNMFEVISGHGRYASPDHRPDILGELVHLEYILVQSGLMECARVVTEYRRLLQTRGVSVTNADLAFMERIGSLFDRVRNPEALEKEMKKLPGDSSPVALFGEMPSEHTSDSDPAILFVGDGDRTLSRRMVEEYLKDYSGVYDYPEQIPWDDLGKTIILWPVNTGIVKPFSARRFPLVYGTPFRMDGISPMPAPTDMTRAFEFPEKLLSSLYKGPTASMYPEKDMVTVVDRKICCSLKRRLRKTTLVRWTEEGRKHLEEWLSSPRGDGTLPDI